MVNAMMSTRQYDVMILQEHDPLGQTPVGVRPFVNLYKTPRIYKSHLVHTRYKHIEQIRASYIPGWSSPQKSRTKTGTR